MKKYYFFAGQMVAMKDSGTFKYFLSDHLGSTSVVLDASGAILSQQRYLPFGGTRTMAPYANITQTDFTYTGQRNLPDTSLMDHKARFYSPMVVAQLGVGPTLASAVTSFAVGGGSKCSRKPGRCLYYRRVEFRRR